MAKDGSEDDRTLVYRTYKSFHTGGGQPGLHALLHPGERKERYILFGLTAGRRKLNKGPEKAQYRYTCKTFSVVREGTPAFLPLPPALLIFYTETAERCGYATSLPVIFSANTLARYVLKNICGKVG